VQRAVLAGDDLTGACTFQIEEGLDTGPVYGWSPSDQADRHQRRPAGSALADPPGCWSPPWTESSQVSWSRSQPADGISYAHKLTVEDGRVVWPAAAIHVDRQIRACTPDPGAWTDLPRRAGEAGPVRPLETAPAGQPLAPGELVVDKRAVWSAPQPHRSSWARSGQGKRRMPAPDWARGSGVSPRNGSVSTARSAGAEGKSGRPGRPPDAGRARPGSGRWSPDPARRAAATTCSDVDERDSYANLALPAILRDAGITGRDAAFAGRARLRRCAAAAPGTRCSPPRGPPAVGGRPGTARPAAARHAPAARHAVPAHAAVSATVDLVRLVAGRDRPDTPTRCCAGWPSAT
jgi:hypothetical protein